MWKITFNTLLAVTLLVAFGCRPPEEETQYNIAKFVSPLEASACMQEPDDGIDDGQEAEECGMQQGCQAVLDDGNKYLGCVPIPSDEPTVGTADDPANDPADDPANDPVGDDDDYTPPVEGDDGYTPPADDDDDDDYTPPSEEDKRDNACSDPEKYNFKVLVCHDTSNPNKGTKHHTICIANQAWENAHSQNSHHEGRDYLGACSQEDLDL